MEHLNAAQIWATRYVHYTHRQGITASLVCSFYFQGNKRDFEYSLNTVNNLSPMLNPES